MRRRDFLKTLAASVAAAVVPIAAVDKSKSCDFFSRVIVNYLRQEEWQILRKQVQHG